MIRRRSSIFAAALTATFFATLIPAQSANIAGTACAKVNSTKSVGNLKFTCIKSGKKLIWNKGVAISATPKATPAPTPTATPTSEPTPTPTPTATPVDLTKPCKLPVADGRGDVSIGGWPRIKERQKTIGTVQIKVVMVDFSDAPASKTPQQAFAMFSGATATFNEVSYGKLNFDLQPTYKWYRMSKPSTSYAPLNKSFETHRAYVNEALTLADSDIDFSNADGFLIIANPDAVGIGYSGPAFSALTGWGVTFDGKTMYNGATSSHDINNWGSIWLNHEMSHTMGLVDVYAATHSDGVTEYDDLFRYTGQFGYMGFSDFNSNAPSLFAYERWNLGWLDDSQVICDTAPKQTLITPVEQAGGVKAVMIPLSPTKEIVIESRRAIGLDSKIAKTGALVYVVDSKKQSGFGPVQVYPIDLKNDPKFLKAPLAAGQSVTVEGYTIKVDSADANGDVVSISKP